MYCSYCPKDTQQDVLDWAEEKGIFDSSDAYAQFGKLAEEVCELDEVLEARDIAKSLDLDDSLTMVESEAKVELGDCLVVLTLIANFLDSDLEECYQLAYNKISKRTGQMIDGVFVKDDASI